MKLCRAVRGGSPCRRLVRLRGRHGLCAEEGGPRRGRPVGQRGGEFGFARRPIPVEAIAFRGVAVRGAAVAVLRLRVLAREGACRDRVAVEHAPVETDFLGGAAADLDDLGLDVDLLADDVEVGDDLLDLAHLVLAAAAHDDRVGGGMGDDVALLLVGDGLDLFDDPAVLVARLRPLGALRLPAGVQPEEVAENRRGLGGLEVVELEGLGDERLPTGGRRHADYTGVLYILISKQAPPPGALYA